MVLDLSEKDLIVGRTIGDLKKYGDKATGYIGKVVVSSGESPVLGKKVLMDLSRSHVAIVCGKRGGGKCLVGDTLITLEDGREIPIKNLEQENKNVFSLNEDQKIKTTKKEHFYKRTVNKTLEITLRTGKKITLTPEHPLLTISGWQNAKELKKGNRIATPRIIPKFGNLDIKDLELHLFSLLYNNTYESKDIYLYLEHLLFLNINDDFNKFIKDIKHKKITKKYLYFPDFIFQLNKKKLSFFLSKVFLETGQIRHYTKDNSHLIYFICNSEKLILQMQGLLLKYGILSKIIKKKNNFELNIFPTSTKEFINKIGFFGIKTKLKLTIKNPQNILDDDTLPKELFKNNKYPIIKNPPRKELIKLAKEKKDKELLKIATSDIFWDEIKEIKEINKKTTVYDITVPKEHNFIANNIIVHNSYSMSVLIEEFAKQPFEIKERLSAIIIDTVGIFWTMKYPNDEGKKILNEWELAPEGVSIRNLIPFGKKEFYEKKKIPFDNVFSIKTSQMDLEDWLGVFRLSWRDPESALLSRTIENLKKKLGLFYDIDDIISLALKDEDTNTDIKNALINRLKVAKTWGLFSKSGTTMKDFAKPGTVTTIDVSTYKQSIGMESVQELIVGILGKRLFEERMLYRKEEEINLIEGKDKTSEMPIVWMMIDEAHMFMPQDRPSMALDVLLQWIRVGRQPGLSLLLATQRPNKLHSEAISQCDFFLSMRMTAQEDINAVSTIRPSYLNVPMDKFYAQMPKSKGFAILVDDNAEKVMLIKIRPRLTWDGGKTANVFLD